MLPLLVKMLMKWSLKELFLTDLSEVHLLNINNCPETDLGSTIKNVWEVELGKVNIQEMDLWNVIKIFKYSTFYILLLLIILRSTS